MHKEYSTDEAGGRVRQRKSMLSKQDVKRMIADVLRTEAARCRLDVLAVLEPGQEEDLFTRMPREVLETAMQKAADLFGYEKRDFSSLDLMADYAFAAWVKNRRLTFFTSGTTGDPKPCVHTLDMLTEESDGLARLFKNVRRVVALVPACHLYGFTFTIALPHTLKVPVVQLAPLPTQDWEHLLQKGDLLVGFPIFWNYWVRMNVSFPPGVEVVTSTAACPPETIKALYQAGAARVSEIYGATETGVIAFRHQAQEPFEIFPFWEASTQNPVLPRIRRQAQPQWQELPDYVSLPGPDKLVLLGRTDEAVQVAGVKVYPKRVEKVLLSHPAVKACRVRLMRPDEGNRLKAFIVLNDGYTPEHLGIIRTYLARRLSVHEFPRSFTFGSQLPLSALGKDADW